MEFLYPTLRQFPMDEVCEQIVREVEKRNFDVPGLTIDFYNYGSGAEKYRMVNSIKGNNFKLLFGRIQRLMPGGYYNDISAITEMIIPGQELQVYEDESGPSFYLYVGDDWEKDKEQFMDGSKVNSKLNNQPRLYLQYKGGCFCGGGSSSYPHTHSKRRPPMLVHYNDLGREYDLEKGDPKEFKTDDVMEAFRKYLTEVVLTEILLQPIPAEHIDPLAEPASIPFPCDVVQGIFCFCNSEDMERITLGKKDASKLLPRKRYGMPFGGRRLLSYDYRNDGTVPEISREGFLWCGVGDPRKKGAALNIPGNNPWFDFYRGVWVVLVNPNRANDVYIADYAPYVKRRAELSESIPADRRRFTDDEVGEMFRASARTIIPITDYKGDFAMPVILINRELDFDEVKIAQKIEKA